jgi:pre-mRNA-splicing factor CWC26
MGRCRYVYTFIYVIIPEFTIHSSDRGNGFEKKLFQHANERKRRGAESYQWGAEDM